jgi:CMP-N,N'-diacetyllegionaminic acid synthase
VRILGLVPARGGSTRLPRKNLARLEGRTLVRRALDAALGAGALDEIVLSSDDPEILAEAEPLPGVTALARPEALATPEARAYHVVLHALAALEGAGSPRFDAVAIVQASSPFTLPEDVAATVELLDRTGAGSAVSVVRADYAAHPHKLLLMEGERLRPFIAGADGLRPEEALPALWLRNGSVYVSRRDTLESGRLLSEDVRGHAMPAERSLDVNTPLDLAWAEFLLARGAQ